MDKKVFYQLLSEIAFQPLHLNHDKF